MRSHFRCRLAEQSAKKTQKARFFPQWKYLLRRYSARCIGKSFLASKFTRANVLLFFSNLLSRCKNALQAANLLERGKNTHVSNNILFAVSIHTIRCEIPKKACVQNSQRSRRTGDPFGMESFYYSGRPLKQRNFRQINLIDSLIGSNYNSQHQRSTKITAAALVCFWNSYF